MGHLVRTLSMSIDDVSVGTLLDQVFDNQEVAMLGSDVKRGILESLCLLVHILTFSDEDSN